MIEWEFRAADLARLRFAHSPLAEVVASAFALRGGGTRDWLQASWRTTVTPLLPRWPTFRAVLLGPRGYAPDFLTPPPRSSHPTLADELAEVAATPLDQVVEQVLTGWIGYDAPPEIVLFLHDPQAARERLLAEIRGYFTAAIKPLWPRLRAAAETEIALRGRAAVEQGARMLVHDLHPKLGWDGDALQLRYPHKHDRWALDDQVMTLLPTGFAGGEIYAMPSGGTLWYAPRGFGNLWTETDQQPGGTSLSNLLGPTRAAVLLLLTTPHSTGEIAARLSLAAGTASHHLTTLRDSGLASAHRSGRRLLYQRTRLGDELCTA